MYKKEFKKLCSFIRLGTFKDAESYIKRCSAIVTSYCDIEDLELVSNLNYVMCNKNTFKSCSNQLLVWFIVLFFVEMLLYETQNGFRSNHSSL